jgi:endonuclease III
VETLLHKVRIITQKLEESFGEPRWPGRGDPLDDLILTVLSQNTNDSNRDVAYRRLRERFADWESVMEAPVAAIADAVRPAGLGNQKAAHIKEILLWVHETYSALNLDFICHMPPDEVQQIFLQRKGIGIKTISVVLMASCGADVFPVDTHVHRLCRRLGLVPEKVSAEKTHELMQPLVPKGKAYSLHINFLKLGRTVCKAQKPSCSICPLAELCPSAIPPS